MSELFERLSRVSPNRLALLVLDLQAKVATLEQAAHEPIAVVGLGCRFPGGADNPDQYWNLLVQGRDAIVEVPRARWNVDTLPDADEDARGTVTSRWGGFLDRLDEFDAAFFGISPREATTLDPQQRLALEVVWEALEHAGYAPNSLSGSPTGVFLGICSGDFGRDLFPRAPELLDAYAATGNASSVAAGRVSYVLGLQGPSLSVDTSCSSSLVAVHLACRSLRAQECRMALAGGVNAILSPDTTIAMSRAGALAPDGRCKAFDAAADGYVRAEGCGFVVLKRLSDAHADGDSVLAVIRGSAVNQDGRSNGLTAPNGPAQVAVIRQALADARIDPADICYVETHGTGTALGDPIEVQALGAALGASRPADRPLLIGSVKTNLGHLEAAAGIAGLIKVILALKYGEIPAHLHFKTPNPHIPWSKLPITVSAARSPWPCSKGHPPRAGVSSFGFSGTNAHLVVEAAPPPPPRHKETERPLHILSLSARSPSALSAVLERLDTDLTRHPESQLEDVAFTANVGRAQLEHRLALIAGTTDELRQLLGSLKAGDAPEHQVRTGNVSGRPPELAFLFTAQGSQYVGMGRELYESQPTFRRTLDRCAELVRPYLDQPLCRLLWPPEGAASDTGADLLDQTTYTQPALFAVQYALAELWRSWGVTPSVVLGHSAGELIAACVAGVFSLEDGLRLATARGRLMQTLTPPGAMVSVRTDERRARAALGPHADLVAIAAVNGPESVTLSGDPRALRCIQDALEREGIETRRLEISIASHSPFMEPMLDEFEQVASTVSYALPQIEVVSGMTGEVVSHELTDPGYWRRHTRETVQYFHALQTLRQRGCRHFLEIGPSPVLIGMGRHCLPDETNVWLPSLRKGYGDWEQLLTTLATLYVEGVRVDWRGFDRDYARSKVPLPTYPFERERFWPELRQHQPLGRQLADQCEAGHPLLGHRLRSPVLEDPVYERALTPDSPAFLRDHRVFDTTILPSPAFVEMALAAAADSFGTDDLVLENLVIYAALPVPERAPRTVQTILRPDGPDVRVCQVYSRGVRDEQWRLHAEARVSRAERDAAALADADESQQLETIQARCGQQVEGTAYYAALGDLGIAFGAAFRGIRWVKRGVEEALGVVELPDILAGQEEAYRIHPALLDACFQTLGAALPDADTTTAYLLVGLDRLRIVRAPGRRLHCHARLRPDRSNAREVVVGDLRCFDDAGCLVAECDGLTLKQTDSRSLKAAIGQPVSEWLYELQWKPSPGARPADTTGGTTPAATSSPPRATWTIFADASGVGEALAALVVAQGDRCSLVVQGTEYAELASGCVAIDPTSPVDVQRALALTPATGTSPHRVVHLWGLDAPSPDLPGAGALAMAGQVGCGSALLIAQALAQMAGEQPATLWLVTRGVHAVGPEPAPTAVSQAAVWGLGRVIALEHPDLWGGLIDLGVEAGATDASRLLGEISRTDGEDQVVLRDSGRHVARLVRCPPSADGQQPLDFSRGSYLITGGLGRLGLLVARWLVDRGARHLVLVSRHGLPTRQDGQPLAPSSRASEQAAAIQELERRGASVRIVPADVADRAAMSELIDALGQQSPPLRGIVHAAGMTANRLVKDLDLATLESALRPKAVGAWLLHELTRNLDLDFFVLFSSGASISGFAGLAHYAAANHVLDVLAHHRHALGLPALSVNWGWWAEGSPQVEAEQLFRRLGFRAIETEPALESLGYLLGTRVPQRIVADIDWDRFRPFYEAGRRRPLLAEIVDRRSSTARVASEARPDLPAQLAKSRPDERQKLIRDRVRREVARVLRLDGSRDIDPQRGLFELGMDSLMAVELKSRLESSIGQPLPSTLTFNYPTIAALAEFLAARLAPPSPDESSDSPGVRTDAFRAASTDGHGTTPVAEPGDELSEDALAALLAEKLGRVR